MRRGLRHFIAFAALPALSGCAHGPQSTLDPAGPAAEAIARTWWAMFWGAAAIWLLVVGFVILALFRGRNPRGLQRPTRIIVGGGLVLPTAALVALLAWGTATSGRVTGLDVAPDHVIEVIGRQWEWEFRYPDEDGVARASSRAVLYLPRGEMVEFRVTSEDVIHGFWIPRLGGKIDAIPGRTNTLRLRVDDDGGRPLRGQCAEFCGLEHTHMVFAVEAMAPAAWRAWRAAGGERATEGAAR